MNTALPSGKYVKKSKLPFINGRPCIFVEDINVIHWHGRMNRVQYRFRDEAGEGYPLIREELRPANAHQRFRDERINKHVFNCGRFLASRDDFVYTKGTWQRAYEDKNDVKW